MGAPRHAVAVPWRCRGGAVAVARNRRNQAPGSEFSEFNGDAFIGGLVSRALVRVDLDGESAKEAERFRWGKRIREVEQGPEGALWVLEDRNGGRLLKLTASK